jgi:hypothetical protein
MGLYDAGEHLAPLLTRQRTKIATIEIEQIESVQERSGGRSLAAPATESLLQGAEVGSTALFVEHDGLTVEDGAIRPEIQNITCRFVQS